MEIGESCRHDASDHRYRRRYASSVQLSISENSFWLRCILARLDLLAAKAASIAQLTTASKRTAVIVYVFILITHMQFCVQLYYSTIFARNQ